jgi:gluconate 5-dehydrogenase
MAVLSGKTALITGAGTGIGFEIAKKFHEQGAKVVICGRREEVLKEASKQISSGSDGVLWFKADICDEEQVIKLVKDSVKATGRLDILVNNAAHMRVDKPPEDTSLGEWKKVLDTNINGVFLCCREAGKVMIQQSSGKIINIASMSGFIVNKYFHVGSYEVSKAAVAMLTKAFAVEWAPYNITVNAIAPGFYETEPNKNFFAREPEIHQKILDMIPLSRTGNLNELASLAVMMATDACNYMTGTTITIDGGYTLW